MQGPFDHTLGLILRHLLFDVTRRGRRSRFLPDPILSSTANRSNPSELHPFIQ
jgi:hypothetical protein